MNVTFNVSTTTCIDNGLVYSARIISPSTISISDPTSPIQFSSSLTSANLAIYSTNANQ